MLMIAPMFVYTGSGSPKRGLNDACDAPGREGASSGLQVAERSGDCLGDVGPHLLAARHCNGRGRRSLEQVLADIQREALGDVDGGELLDDKLALVVREIEQIRVRVFRQQLGHRVVDRGALGFGVQRTVDGFDRFDDRSGDLLRRATGERGACAAPAAVERMSERSRRLSSAAEASGRDVRSAVSARDVVPETAAQIGSVAAWAVDKKVDPAKLAAAVLASNPTVVVP